MGRMIGAFDNPEELDRPDLNKCPDCECYFEQDECPLCGKTCPEEMRAGNRKKVKKFKFRKSSNSHRVVFISWYHSWLAIILFTIFMPIIGIVLLITSPHKARYKIIFIAVIVLVFTVIPFAIMTITLNRITNAFTGTSNHSNLSKEEYISRCKELNLHYLYDNTDDYLGEMMRVEVEVLDKQLLWGRVYYICSSVNGGYPFLLRDCMSNGEEPSVGDRITVYGECVGDLKVTSNGQIFNTIGMNMFYYDLTGESSLHATEFVSQLIA